MRRATLSDLPRLHLSERAAGRATLAADTGAVAHLFVLEQDIVRLLLLSEGRVTSPPSWAIAAGADDIAEPGRDRMGTAGFTCPDFTLEEADGRLMITTRRLRVSIRLHGLHCRWEQRDGDEWRPMAQDRPTQAYDFGWWDGRAHHHLARRPGERYYGLGERAGDSDRAGRHFRLINVDPMGYDAEWSDPLYKAIPYLLVADADGACHGAFYDTLADVAFDFGRELDNYHGPYRHMVADAGDVDLWMIAGPDPRAVTKRFTWLTGRPAMMPRWSLGYSGSTMSYTDAPDAAAQMAGFLRKLAEHDLRCTSFHLSSGYTSIGAKRYVFNWNRDKFPDPAAFVASFREAGVHLVPNIKPALLVDHPRFAECAGAGLFVGDGDGAPVEAQFWDEVGGYIDFTNPDAARWWRERVTDALLDHGVDATWNDNNEYEVWNSRTRFHGFGTARPAAEMRPLQAMPMMRASRRAQVEARPDRRPLCRHTVGHGRAAALRADLDGRQPHRLEDDPLQCAHGDRPRAVGRIEQRPRCRRVRQPRALARTARALGAGGRADAAFQHPQLERRRHRRRAVDVPGGAARDPATDGAASDADPVPVRPAAALRPRG